MNHVYLSICAIVRHEAPYIAEWIEFHRLVGVQRFYLYDDASDDDTVEIINRRNRGDIVLEPWKYDPACVCRARVPFRKTHQVIAYNDCIRRRADETTWCAFIDADEYLYHGTEDDIIEPLCEDIEMAGESALFVNWLIFGSNGHATKPDGLTIESYTKRGQCGHPVPYGHHGKLIARLDRLGQFGAFGSHNAAFISGHAVDEKGRPIAAATNARPSADRWRLNHYYHRSADETVARVEAIDNNAVKGYHKTADRMRRHDLNDEEDTGILRFLPRLKEVLES